MAWASRKTSIDIAELRQDFYYRKDDGLLFWSGAPKRKFNVHKDRPAGSVVSDGYIKVKYRGKCWLSHVLIWALEYGSLPDEELDHINRCRSDNRLCNLRLATRRENALNRGPSNGITVDLSVSRLPRGGVSFWKRPKKWVASIQKDGKRLHLGYFATRDEADIARSEAVKRFYGKGSP